jgi:hypothetical protein
VSQTDALREIGLRGPHVRADALIGLAVALAFAALQFGVLIPATGGAERSDIVVNAAQIGESSLLHGYQGWAGVIDAGFFGGLVLTGLFLWRRGRPTACVVAHAAWNSLATIGIWLWY